MYKFEYDKCYVPSEAPAIEFAPSYYPSGYEKLFDRKTILAGVGCCVAIGAGWLVSNYLNGGFGCGRFGNTRAYF